MILRQLDWRRVPPDLPDFIPDSIDDRLAQIALHCADVLRLEEIEPLDQVERSFLHEIVGIEAATGGYRQLPVAPAP